MRTVANYEENNNTAASDDVLRSTFEKVEQAKREWESTVDSLPDLVILVDRQARVLRANRIVETWGLSRVKVVRGRDMHELLHPACNDSACYLTSFARHLVLHVAKGASIQLEADDPVLGRSVHISARPVLGHAHGVSDSLVVIVRDITEQKRVEQEREELIAELGAFAHTVAHDLKNPVGLVINYVEMLEIMLKSSGSAEALTYAQAIVRNSYKLNDIIDELLLLAEVRDGDVRLAPLNMNQVVEEALQRMTVLLRQNPAEIIRPASWPRVVGYAPWVEEVWANYVSNALKYGGEPAQLELGNDPPVDGWVRFWVRDNGNGISPEMQARLFLPFTRLVQVRATGHGLGLSIARRIIEKLGGQVGVESEGVPGRGSLFYFTLPTAPDPR